MEGISTFYVNKDGKIIKHRVDRVGIERLGKNLYIQHEILDNDNLIRIVH